MAAESKYPRPISRRLCGEHSGCYRPTAVLAAESRPPRAEKTIDAAGELIHGMHRIARQRAEPFVSFDDILFCDGPVSERHAGKTRRRLAAEDLHQIQQMASQHPQVFGPPALVFLSARAHFEDRSQFALFDQALDGRNDRAIPRLMRNREFGVRHLARADDLIGLGKRAAEWL